MRLPILLLFTFALGCTLFAQTNNGDIEIKKGFGGIKLYQNGILLKPKQVLGIVEPNTAAHTEFKKAKSNYDAAQVIGCIGGFMVGWPLGTAIGGGTPQWGLAAGGAGLILLTIPFASAYNSHARKAVELYNSGGAATGRLPVKISVVPHGGGASIVMRF